MTRTIDNTQDVLDSRDVIARIEELETERQDLVDAFTEASESLESTITDKEEDSVAAYTKECDTAKKALADWDEDYKQELDALAAFLEEMKGNGGDEQWRGDWYPVTIIRDSYFEDYAQELAEDIGAVNKDTSWPNTYIDWEAAAEALQQDYTPVEFDGVTYWVR